MDSTLADVLWILLTILLVIINGFFVAAEFALVKVRGTRLQELVRGGKPFANTARWLMLRLDRALSACQLGITMASLGLGWIGEPAIARLLEPAFAAVGISSSAVIHTVSFLIAFSLITAAHLVVGEQAPKIFAIRRPEAMALWCAVPLKWFYLLTYPLLVALSASTAFLLRLVGIEGGSGHEVPHSEEEIRALLSQAHAHGELTRSEARLLDAVFEFDDTVCRQIMVPRVEVEYFDVARPVADALARARATMHTRYPLCEGSLDHVLGFVHIKDLLGVSGDDDFDLRSIVRPPRMVPETMPISRLLGHFRASRQHMAFVIDEHGAVAGIVTMENVLERIVGPVQDEFDTETPDVVPDGPGRWIVNGGAQIDRVKRSLPIEIASEDVDTISGLLMERAGRVLTVGDRIDLDGATAEVLEAKSSRATKVRIVVDEPGRA